MLFSPKKNECCQMLFKGGLTVHRLDHTHAQCILGCTACSDALTVHCWQPGPQREQLSHTVRNGPNTTHNPPSLRLRQPNQQFTTKQQARLKLTTKSEDDTENDDEQDDDDTSLILSNLSTVEPPQHQSNHIQRSCSATRFSHDTRILSEPHLFSSTDARPLHSTRQEI